MHAAFLPVAHPSLVLWCWWSLQELAWQLDAKEGEVKDLREQLQSM